MVDVQHDLFGHLCGQRFRQVRLRQEGVDPPLDTLDGIIVDALRGFLLGIDWLLASLDVQLPRGIPSLICHIDQREYFLELVLVLVALALHYFHGLVNVHHVVAHGVLVLGLRHGGLEQSDALLLVPRDFLLYFELGFQLHDREEVEKVPLVEVPVPLLLLGQLDILESLQLTLDVVFGSRFRGLPVFQGGDLCLGGVTPAPRDPLVEAEDNNRGQDRTGRHQEVLVSHETP